MEEKIRLLIANFMEHNSTLTKLENEDWYNVENGLVNMLINDDTLRFLIYRSVEQEYHKEDIRNEIEYMNDNEDTKITLTDDLLHDILVDYEEFLGDGEEWHYKLKEAISRNVYEC